MNDYTLWIEAESWEPGTWNPENDATDVVLSFPDGSRWVATFCAFAHVEVLRRNCAASGECLGGKYLWGSDLILVDDTSRASIEAVVRDLIERDELEIAFSEWDDDEQGDRPLLS